jgi:hypothetical protein
LKKSIFIQVDLADLSGLDLNNLDLSNEQPLLRICQLFWYLSKQFQSNFDGDFLCQKNRKAIENLRNRKQILMELKNKRKIPKGMMEAFSGYSAIHIKFSSY